MSRPARIKAAVLRVLDGLDLSGEFVSINYVGDEVGFELQNTDGARLAVCEHPTLLAEYAFSKGAFSVTHSYDLRLAE